MSDEVRVNINDPTTAEQQARDMLERLGHPRAQELTAGDVVELANLINENEERIRYNAHLLAIISERPEPPLLICVSCRNTESPAGAMARQHWHHGLCMHCGGAFKVVRA